MIAWFAEHRVAANMLMWIILGGGLLMIPTLDQEVFPEVDADVITVGVEVRGATPEEIEEGVCIKIEEAVDGIDGIDRVSSTASRDRGSVSLEVDPAADMREVLDDVKSAVDSIDTFPDEAEEPIVQEFELAKQVLNVAVAGDVGEHALRVTAEDVRADLLALDGVTRVSLANARPFEVSIEVSEVDLRRWGLTFDEVAAAVRRQSLDLTGGTLKTTGGEILLRTKAQAYDRDDFERLIVRTLPDGSRLRLADVARVVDGFEDTGQDSRFDGQPAVLVKVYRVGDERALDIADRVREYVAVAESRMPAGVSLTIWQDDSRVLRSRLDLLSRNGKAGLLLVFLTLALFLRLGLAFWVTLGIPVSFLGTVWLMPGLDVSINLISLFGFIVALGIVVDDAIVVGENIYRHHEEGARGLAAAVAGARQVSAPVIFAILTTIAAFSPLTSIPGVIGKFIGQMPRIVVPILLFSMVESLLILPAHLSHLGQGGGGRRPFLLRAWERVQDGVSAGMQWVIHRTYAPTLEWALRWRGLTVAIAASLLLVTGSLFGAGAIRFVFFPPVEADNIVAFLTMPRGTPDTVTAAAVRELEAAALAMADDMERRLGQPVVRHALASVGNQPFRDDQRRGFGNATAGAGRHLGEVNLELVPSEEREVRAGELLSAWRERVGAIPGAVELVFSSNLMSTGEAVNVQLTGTDVDDLRRVADGLKAELAARPGVFDVADSFRAGQQELRLAVTPEAEAAGIDLAALSRQVRQGFYGEEIQRVQRGRDEVRVMLRYPETERRSISDVDEMRIRLADGTEVPFSKVARVQTGRGDAQITRTDRRRSINVTADVDLAVNDPNTVVADLQDRVLPALLEAEPGVGYSLEGEQKEQADTVEGLVRGFVLALIFIYALLAVPFRSYVQPLIVMLAIPFGIMGAVWGHLAMGMDLTVMSMFGIVALTGVLVNDSLVLVDFVNQQRRSGLTMTQAVRAAGPKRFRAITLTSLTTFAGLTPLLLERSLQAQFLIPMAVSLGFGVLVATGVTLVLVPVGCLLVDDVERLVRRLLGLPAAEVRGRLGAET